MRKWNILLVLAVAGGIAFQGCAKQQEPGGTSTDSTLSLGDFPESGAPTPDTSLAMPEPTPAPVPPPPSPAPRTTTPKPRTPSGSSGSSSSQTAGVTVPAGTALKVTMAAEVTTKDMVAGDTFSGTLAEDVVADGKVVFPAGSTVSGHIAEAVRPGKTSGRGKMVLSYDTISANGRTYAIDTMGPAIEGKSGTAGDAAKVVGGAAAGAILGKIIGGTGGSAAKGAAIGAGAGAAAGLATRGPDPKVEAGQTVEISMDKAVTVRL
jgi:hypothetical protein